MNKIVKKLLPFIILIISLGLSYIILRDHIDELSQITKISLSDFFLISVLVLLFMLVQGVRNKWLLKIFGIQIPYREAFGLSVINSFWNYLPFQGGMVAKGVFLKQRYQFPYSDYLAVVSVSIIVTFIVLGVFGILSALAIYIYNGSFSLIVTVFYTALVLVTVIIIFIIRARVSIRWFRKIAERMYSGILLVLRKREIIVKLVVLDIISTILFAARFSAVSSGLGFDIPILFFMLVAPVALLSIFISLTPGGLIVREALVGFFAALLFVDVTDSVVVTVLDRGVSLLWIFLLGIVFNVVFSRIIAKSKSIVRSE